MVFRPQGPPIRTKDPAGRGSPSGTPAAWDGWPWHAGRMVEPSTDSPPGGAGTVAVYLEAGDRRSFAVAVDWPGWARSGRTAEAALDALATYLPRYADVVRAAGLEPPPVEGPGGFEVVETVPGNATTSFGAPGVVPDLDRHDLTAAEGDRQARLAAAAWARLDEAAAAAPPELRKGPRGGGRDRDPIVEHVLRAEHAYLRKAGLRLPMPADRAGFDELRERFLDLLRAPGEAPSGAPSGWPLPYAVRRVAWHALDHAWEIEDRH